MTKSISVKYRTADIIGAILILIFAAAAIYATTTWLPPVLSGDPGAAFFPRIALGIMVFFSTVLLFQRVRTSQIETDSEESKSAEIPIGPLCAAVCYSGLAVIGIAIAAFEISGFAFLAFMLGVRTNNWFWAIITALISVLLMYFIFIILLNVRLPLLFLPEYFGF